MAIQVGQHLGPYEILSAIGAGGMGEVYRARDTRLDRIIAIKVLPAHLADKPELREQFEREARTIASLNHPHICTLYDIGYQNGTDYLVAPFSQILFGSDYPFVPVAVTAEGMTHLGLSATDLQEIGHDNAMALLRRPKA